MINLLRVNSVSSRGLCDPATDLEALAQKPEDEEVEGWDDEGEEDHDGDARDGVAQVMAADVLPRRLDEDAEVGLQETARRQQGVRNVSTDMSHPVLRVRVVVPTVKVLVLTAECRTCHSLQFEVQS